MTIAKKRGGKVITKDIENNFGLILHDLSELEPIPKSIKKSATSLIIEHHQEIKALLDRGFSAEQIVQQLSRINLDLTPETLRTVIRNTDDNGNRITNKKKPCNSKRKPIVKPQDNAISDSLSLSTENPTNNIEAEAPIVVAFNNESKTKRLPAVMKESF